jgi:pSer/pThr/pTyr-binding forkhead associated (FHA) protein
MEQQGTGLPEKAYLVVHATVFPLNKKVITIGRNLENDLVINDPTISRYHAEIRYEDSQFILVDLDSSGGTYLNNRKIHNGVLFSGDIILFSKLPVMFMSEGATIKNQSGKRTGRLGNN